MDDDKISIENGSMEDPQITILYRKQCYSGNYSAIH